MTEATQSAAAAEPSSAATSDGGGAPPPGNTSEAEPVQGSASPAAPMGAGSAGGMSMAEALAAWKVRQSSGGAGDGSSAEAAVVRPGAAPEPSRAAPESQAAGNRAIGAAAEPSRSFGAAQPASDGAEAVDAAPGVSVPPELPVDISNEITSLDRIALYKSRFVECVTRCRAYQNAARTIRQYCLHGRLFLHTLFTLVPLDTFVDKYKILICNTCNTHAQIPHLQLNAIHTPVASDPLSPTILHSNHT